MVRFLEQLGGTVQQRSHSRAHTDETKRTFALVRSAKRARTLDECRKFDVLHLRSGCFRFFTAFASDLELS